MVIRCRRAVLGEGSELRNGPSPEYPPWCDENSSDIGGEGVVEGCCLTVNWMEVSQLYLCPRVDYLDCVPPVLIRLSI